MKEIDKDITRLRHILDAVGFIEQFSAEKTKKDLYENFMYRFSVERQLEIIGEASNNLSEDIYRKYSDVPWPQVISFRNFIVHEYFGLDLELVWSVITNHIPLFKTQVEAILSELM